MPLSNIFFQLGVNLDSSNPAYLWEDGDGTFSTDLISVSTMLKNPLEKPYFNFTATGTLVNASTNNQSLQQIICQRPAVTSFCVDLPSLTSAMSKIGKKFVGTQIQTSKHFSSFSCLQYCNSLPTNVRKTY